MKLGSLRTILQATALLVAATAAVPMAASAQAVEGRIVDLEGAPVTGATVILLDASYQPVTDGRTDSDGRYRLEAESAGEHHLVVDREGFASETQGPFTLRSGQDLTFDVTISGQAVGRANLAAADTMSDADLLATAIAQACQGTFVPSLHGILFGAIRDARTDITIPSASAVVTWEDRIGFGSSGTRLETRSDDSGAYVLCNAPAAENLTVRASAVGTEGRSVNVRLQAGHMQRLDLTIPLNDPDQGGDVLGHILDQNTGRPVKDAEVTLKDTEFRAFSDERGVFYFSDVPWGFYALTVDHLAYGHQEQAVQVIGGRAQDLEIRVAPEAIAVAPILVEVRGRSWFRRRVDLEHRIDLGIGTYRFQEDIEEMNALNLAQALQGLPGVNVTLYGSSSVSGTYVVQMRNAQDMEGNPCPPVVWVDGTKWGKADDVYHQIGGWEIDVVEIYRGPSQVPAEYLDMEASCGVIAVWTKRGIGG